MDQLPAKYIEKCVIIKKIFNQNQNDLMTFCFTINFEVIEVKNKQIINYINLKPFFNENSVVYATEDRSQMKIYYRNNESILLLLKVDQVLIILHRSIEINMIHLFNNVFKFKLLNGQNYRDEDNSYATITFNNGEEERISSVNDLKSQEKNECTILVNVENQLEVQKQKIVKTLESVKNQQRFKVRSMIGERMLLPHLMRLNDVTDLSPLVRFGTIFTRTCNQKLCVGIPIFNSSSLERRALLERIKLIATCSSISNFNFKYNLYKMKTNCPSFEEFEKFFDHEKTSFQEVPKFNQDWTPEKFNPKLFTGEAAVIVATFCILQFLHESYHEIVFNISYEINNEQNQTKLLINVGKIFLNSSSIFSRDLEVTSWKSEKYRNLIAITSTADAVVDIEILFESHSDIENFLQNKLNFEVIKTKADEEERHFSKKTQLNDALLSLRSDFFLYCPIGYFQGVLIRLNLENDLLMKAKIYVKTSHQLIILIQSIYQEYSNHCTIELKKFYGASEI
ncbi:hypothetical protein PVAND_014175 [Polypedilum vanderplanki]|uniref:Uncharacterized protein n=1 Tax=Polypedilum vanderplanki TaxID=319348 RepID=A0A9J6CRJ5_POLVA|nr:hypothetical protein PVAND_014175 [Polypedilum vanderplanki]